MKIRRLHRIKSSWLFPILLIFLFISACRLMMLESRLDPESKEFYSVIRYIITAEERKIFLELPLLERKKFVEDFWNRRDSYPETEENEFKTDYLNKIETANRLFQGGGKAGFIQDRGRIYILLGPPDERYSYPTGTQTYPKPLEVWIYYRKYQIRLEFIDHTGDGEYTLERPSTYALQEINSAQAALQSPEKFKKEK